MLGANDYGNINYGNLRLHDQVLGANGWPPMLPANPSVLAAGDLDLAGTLADYQPDVAFGGIGLYNRGTALLVLRTANASTGSIMVQSGVPLTILAFLPQHYWSSHALSSISSIEEKYFKGIGIGNLMYEGIPSQAYVDAKSPGVISFATTTRSHLLGSPSVGDTSSSLADTSGVSGMQAAVLNKTVKAAPRAHAPASSGLDGSVPGLLVIAGGEIPNDPFKVRSSHAGIRHDFAPPSLSFGYSFIHNMGALANGGGFNSFSDGHGGYGMNDTQQLTLGVNTNLGDLNLASSTNYDLVNGGWEYDLPARARVAVADAISVLPAPPEAKATFGAATTAASPQVMNPVPAVAGRAANAPSTPGTRTSVLGAPVALELSPQVVEFNGYVNYGAPISGTSVSSGGVISTSGPVSMQPPASSQSVFASVLADAPKDPAGIRQEGEALTKTGAGALTLAGANTYTGATTINGGTLSVSNGAAMPSGDAFAPMLDDLGAMKRNSGAPLNVNGSVATGATAAPAAAPASVLVTDNRGLAVKDGKNIGGLGASAAPVQNPPVGAVDAFVSFPTATPQAAAVDKVQSGLMLGNSAVESGNYDAAITQYQNVLRTDPYNQAARRGMEAADKKRQAYFKTAYDSQRSKMLAQITETWEDKVPVQEPYGSATMGKDVKTDDFYLVGKAAPVEESPKSPSQPSAGESYTRIIENEMKDVAREPLSTLSIDVDTASYANVRRFLNQNMLPPPDAVRIEELVNYFPTSEEGPAHEAKEPFGVRVELAPCPWQPVHRLARISIKGREMDKNRKASNLVFLVDVSGSMNEPAKLPLVQQSLRMLTEQLGEGDLVTMVVYAGSSGVVLPPTSGEKKEEILAAINRLSAGGSTHGSAGIQLAYEQAVAGFIKGGVNRVILCTDGDFNVGVSSPEELEKLIKHKAKSGVFLSVLGFGSGNLKDRTMETLADKGNGNYAYIDSLSEARKVLVEQMGSTLETIAKDVKIQVEFNPAAVRGYRLIGYENRVMAKEDFNDDTKDAGEIGAGHSVVALYEVVPANLPAGAEGRPAVDSLKYQAPAITPAQLAEAAKSGELMTVKLRYKEPESDLSKLIEVPTKDEGKTLTASSEEFKFSAAVAGFGLLLRDSSYKGSLSWETVRRLALDGKGADKLGYRGEFLQLIDKARGLKETR